MSATLTPTTTLNTYGLSKVRTGKTIDINLVPDGCDTIGHLTLSIHGNISDNKAIIRSGGWEDVVCISNDVNKIANCVTEQMGNSVQTNAVNHMIRDAIADAHTHKSDLNITVHW